jgi:hypothetical protein
MTTSLGRQLVDAIAARDPEALAALLDPGVDFRGLTPGRFWEAVTPDEAVEVVFGSWFTESDRIDAVAAVDEGEPVGDTQRIGYRLDITNPAGPHQVEQQVYYRAEGGRLSYLRVVCSGYRPV